MIARPEITTAQIILLMLTDGGRMSFADIMRHPSSAALGAPRTENSFYTALARLKRRGHIIRTPDRHYELTAKGEYAALKAYVRRELVSFEQSASSGGSGGASVKNSAAPRESAGKNKSWDGRWRVILFDIPENKRPLRDYIRGVLQRFGCVQFQRSMWIYPFKLPAFIPKLFEDPQLRKYARILTTSDIDYDEDLRRQFKLA